MRPVAAAGGAAAGGAAGGAGGLNRSAPFGVVSRGNLTAGAGFALTVAGDFSSFTASLAVAGRGLHSSSILLNLSHVGHPSPCPPV